MTQRTSIEERDDKKAVRFMRPGGTSGGLGSFVVGLGLAVVGLFLIFNQVQVGSGYWSWWGTNTFGLTLVPLILGVGLLFFDGSSIAGWVLAIAGVLIIVAGVLVNLHMYFRTTSLYEFLLMAGLFAAGLGLMARSLKSL